MRHRGGNGYWVVLAFEQLAAIAILRLYIRAG
jgi:hypothetical protein